MSKLLFLMAAASGLVYGGCFPISGSHIFGRDLVQADARFAALPATLIVGFPPPPGAQRVFHAADLQRIARANGVGGISFADICFELPMRRFTEAEALAAMRQALPMEATLKIVEVPALDVPAGAAEFPVEGIEPPTPAGGGIQLWRGYVRYAETRRISVWARVSLAVKVTAVVTDRDLPRDLPISASALRVETRLSQFDRLVPATRIEEVAGRIPKHALRAGSIIPMNALTEAPTVRRGDSVPVVVESGMAKLRFDAIAESSARDGDVIELRNPANGKVFKARLDPGPKAFLVISGGRSL